MTENEVLEIAKSKLKEKNAAYMREWRKKNPDKDRIIRERYKQKRLIKTCREVEEGMKEGKRNDN